MFGRKSNKKQGGAAKPEKKSDAADGELELVELDSKIADVVSTQESGTGNFFCTDDPFVQKFDDRQLMAYVAKRIPGIAEEPGSPAFKQAVTEFLSDKDFFEMVADEFDLTVHDLLKFVFRIDPSAFKGMFMKKVKEIVSGTDYAC